MTAVTDIILATTRKFQNSTLFYSFGEGLWSGLASAAGGGDEVYFNTSLTPKTVLTSYEKVYTEHALELWDAIASLSISPTSSEETTADIYIYKADLILDNGTAIGATGYFQATEQSKSEPFVTQSYVRSEIAIDNNISITPQGTAAFKLMLHEIGHALGLVHPASGYYTSLMTVMSYIDPSTSPATIDHWAITPMAYDIAAIQMLYGTSPYNSENETSYNSNSLNITGNMTAQTILDTGGINDVIDLSGISGSHFIDLRETIASNDAWLDNKTIVANKEWIYIARGSIIENAIGGDSADVITGNNYNNIIDPGLGQDETDGGLGNDIFIATGGTNGLEGDWYDGGTDMNPTEINGLDTVIYSRITSYGLEIDLSGTNQGPNYEAAASKVGGGGASDVLISTENAVGSTASDFITGSDEEKNILVGYEGNDTFYATHGDDVYHGGYTDTELDPFWDLDSSLLNDLARAVDGTDTVNYLGLTGVVFDVTVLDETLGNYWVDKYYNGTYFYGPWDRDVLFSIEELEIDAYARRDVGGATAAGNENNNSLHYNNFGGYNVARNYYGYGGIDNITAGHKNDFLSGGTGDDNLSGSTGDDNYFYNLGDGDDYINDAGSGSIDALIFGDGILPSEVTLARYSGSNMIITFMDNAEITLYAQTYGTGNAIDYFKFDDGTIWDMQATIVPVYGTSGNDNNLQGTGSTSYREGAHINDVMYGYGGNDLIRSYDGDDILWGGEGDDDLRGGLDNDTLYGENGNDSMSGENGNDILYGGDGNDSMNGGHTDNGNDTLYGGGGNDTMNAFGGNDVLWGGAGLDTMAGGVGADTFVFEAASAFLNIDVITDFKLNDNDTLNIADILEGYYDFGVDAITDFVQITQSGATAYLSIAQNGGGGGSYVQIATLSNVSGQALTDEAALEASGRLITHV